MINPEDIKPGCRYRIPGYEWIRVIDICHWSASPYLPSGIRYERPDGSVHEVALSDWVLANLEPLAEDIQATQIGGGQ